ncbi:MAG: hypothetical protein AB4426_25785 [Xenococcaceae cyanobacterium]
MSDFIIRIRESRKRWKPFGLEFRLNRYLTTAIATSQLRSLLHNCDRYPKTAITTRLGKIELFNLKIEQKYLSKQA